MDVVVEVLMSVLIEGGAAVVVDVGVVLVGDVDRRSWSFPSFP